MSLLTGIWNTMSEQWEYNRRKAQETTRKEETMPTLLDDLIYVYKGITPAEKDAAYDRIKAFIEANTPWLPPQQEGFGPWIEYRVGDPGPRVGDEVVVMYNGDRSTRDCSNILSMAYAERWAQEDHIVAYCVKLDPANE